MRNPEAVFAIKIISKSYLEQKKAKKRVKKEEEVLAALDHESVIKLYDCGPDGVIQKASGKFLIDHHYMIMEYSAGPLLFDIHHKIGALGEQIGFFFAAQLLDCLEYLQARGVAHRDIKLENILLDGAMNLKLADFGFAADKNIDKLSKCWGTRSYMAPEILAKKQYNGHSADIFSTGVVLFILTVGYIPFRAATPSDRYFHLLCHGQRDKNGLVTEYWNHFAATRSKCPNQPPPLSTSFKSLLQHILAPEPHLRPSLREIKRSAWF